MEKIYRKIGLENLKDFNYGSETYGSITATTLFLNVFITSDYSNLGVVTDIDFLPKNNASQISYPIIPDNQKMGIREPLSGVTDYYNFDNSIVTGTTSSRIDDVMSYNEITKFIPNFDIDTSTYINYIGDTINGVNRFIISGDPSIYVFDAKVDSNIGTDNQMTGLQFKDYGEETTEIRFIGEGLNQTNITLKANIREEYLLGIVEPNQVKSDILIDRGYIGVIENHIKLGEINNMSALIRYGNGYFKIR